MRFVKLIFSVLFAILMVWLAVVNRGRVEWTLAPLPWRLEMPLYLVMFGGLALGLIVGIIVGWFRNWPSQRALRDAKLRIANLTNEVHELTAAADGQTKSR